MAQDIIPNLNEGEVRMIRHIPKDFTQRDQMAIVFVQYLAVHNNEKRAKR